MENNIQNPDKQTETFQEVKKAVDECVYKKISVLSAHNKQVNHDLIERECIDEVFKIQEDRISEEITRMGQFVKQLVQDDPQLFKEIKARALNSVQQGKDGTEGQNVDEGIENTTNILSKEEIEKLYQIGANWFSNKNYINSYLYFTYLSLADPENSVVWMARGMVEQQNGNYEEALISYGNSIRIEPGNLLAYIHLMNCLIQSNHRDTAKQIYEEFIQVIDPQDVAFLENDMGDKLDEIKEALIA